MDFDNNTTSHAQMLEPPPALGHLHCYESAPNLSKPAPSLPTALLPAGIAAPLTSPQVREWEDLTTFTIPDIRVLLHSLNTRCLSTRAALDTALTDLETSTHLFLAADRLTCSSSMTTYLSAYSCARRAGQALFAPQDAYRRAVATLGMLVADLIDVLPGDMESAAEVDARFKRSVREAGEREDAVRKHMRGLADGRSWGREGFALEVYLDTARKRFGSWSKEEERLVELAGECVRALREW